MAWIDDVVTRTTIRSVWGNSIRDSVVLHFATKAERNTTAHPVDGMCCYCADTQSVYLYRAGAWWPAVTPWRSFTATLWFYRGLSGAWFSQTGTGFQEARIQRQMDTVYVRCVAGWDSQQAAPSQAAIQLPVPHAEAVGWAFGNGWVQDPGAGMRYKGGGLTVAVIPPGGQQALQVIDMQTGGGAQTAGATGSIIIDAAYVTTQADDTP
jgi:hypothetical protein